jgi:hypothetical protein
MGIKIGLYDFFARTIPGGIFLFALLYILRRYQIYSFSLANISAIELPLFAICSYIVGFIIDPIANKYWYRFFNPKGQLHEKTMMEWNKNYSGMKVQTQEMPWSIPLSFIKRHNLEMAYDVERFNVMSIMLRGASLGALVFMVIFAIEFISRGFLWRYLIFSLLCLTAAIISILESVKFRTWFYKALYESVIALIITPEQLPIKFKTEVERDFIGEPSINK